VKIRIANLEDAQGILNIYAPYILDTAVSFETSVPTISVFKNRIKEGLITYPWVVAEVDQKIVGYAYASAHRSRCAYSWSADSSAYISPSFHGKGIAHKLYEYIFSILEKQYVVNVFAGITLPNEKSVGFHEALGFVKIGHYKKVGYKLDCWHDVGWWQKELISVDKPREIIPFEKVQYEI